LYLTGRKDYIINISGEKVNPLEIEEIVKSLENIDEVIAIGIDHQVFGQAIKLLVKIKEGKKMDSSDILSHCKQNLERFKVPIEVEFVPDFPKNEYGKIIRFKIKEDNNGNS